MIVGDAEPDPTTARTPAEFVERLAALRVWAGQPSLRRLHRLAGQVESAGGDRVDALPPSTTSYVLTGKTLPSLPRKEFVDAFVTACLAACGMPVAATRDRLRRWTSAWRALASPTPDDAADGDLAARQQLPMDIAEFTGRTAELERLHAIADRSGATAVGLVTIDGMPGVGKTRFAVHAAHELTRRSMFDEVQLWSDLRGFDLHKDRADPADVLAGFLRLLGVPGNRIPHDLDERAALYRGLLAGKRALVLLDNVASEDQVRPLIPGGAGCLVLVTSRHVLPGLDGAHRLPLDVFTPDDAVSLLARIAGEDRVRTESAAAARVVELCGNLPLQVAVAARRLRARSAWTLGDLADRLAVGQPGDADSPAGASFDLSYQSLSPPLQRLFRLLGLHPGRDFTVWSAAALAGSSVGDAERLLETLLDEHLLQQETAGRYRFHDLLRRYANELARTEEPPDRQHQALTRFLTWLLHTADAAVQALEPYRRRTFDLIPANPAGPVPAFDSRADALTWCETERTNLIAAIRTAAATGHTDIAWQLPAVLLRFFYLRSHWTDWLNAHRLALDVTREAGAAHAEATILNGLGVAYGDLRRFPEAIDCCTKAAALFAEVGNTYGQAWSHNNLGVTNLDRGRLTEGVDHLEHALPLFRQSNDPEGEAICLANLAEGYRRLHQPKRTIDCLQRALDRQRQAGDHTGQRYTLGALGDLYRETRQYDRAVRSYERALAAHRAAGDRRGTARTLHSLGRTLTTLGQTDAANNHLAQAHAIFTTLGSPEADTVRRE